ncbi:ATP-grasp domain-containing protein [Methyloglobulus sp.]|uniref:ATP-grasp domain-containing protein n=1 Tax=Methyloglobulus sp. TaxID=2518622 RepID=UPI0039891B0E
MKKLKVLIFEYITGGGLNKSDLPESLAREGLLMMQSLIDNLAGIDTVEPLIMLDFRIAGRLASKPANTHIIGLEQECHQEFIRLMSLCDAIWPIAPECDSILQTLCEEVGRSGKLLLTSSASVVAIVGNKWLTYGHLRRHSIATVETQRLASFSFTPGEWIVKPIDGVGCMDSHLITDQEDFDTITAALDKGDYIVQPHLKGEKTSLSCLFKQGRGWLVSANRQQFAIINKQYHLTGITVNFTSDTSLYQALVNDVATAMPDLWAYVGIDLIETPDQILVLEINPRLTTSYAGIYAARGINCARAVVELLTGDPVLQPTRNQPVYIQINGQENDAK